MSTAAHRKRKGAATNNCRQRRKKRVASNIAAMAEDAETINLEESGEEVVDLTCESSDPVVVDLTHNDSVVIVEDTPNQRRPLARTPFQSTSCVLSSDDEDSRGTDVLGTKTVSTVFSSLANDTPRSSSGTVSCPICMDFYNEIIQSGRLIVSTRCGHIFCSQCLRDALKNTTSCPTCRKKLTSKQYHPIYI
ncbi:E3 ubiquitin-protein ligase RNF4 [Bombina bombina]|uniref:E3 ubiquitin-protein ligase RNF4 n=1 Tax=Bombina bombina TaxID=8345 RepID=UPI00235A9A4E|nr:E3 ubiquitin-protein ligase RNF4 [Bombina bombina]